jgi:hypothetical protein
MQHALQALVALIPPVLSFMEAPFWRPTPVPTVVIKRVQTTAFALILTGTALLIAAFIQANTFGLSVYHATIVLYLSWINNITACAILLFHWLLDSIRIRDTSNWQRIASKEFAAYSLHLSATGALGIWLFSDPLGFDTAKQCSDSTVIYIFGQYPRVAAPHPRIVWLVVYSTAAVPILNWIATTFLLAGSYVFIFIIFALVVAFAPLYCCCCCFFPCVRRLVIRLPLISYVITRCFFRWVQAWPKPEPTHAANPFAPTAEELNIPETVGWAIAMRFFPAGWILFILIVDIWIFVSMEKTIANNNVGSGEGQWTFGQTLALLVVVFPVMDVWRQAREMLNNRRAREHGVEGPHAARELREVCVAPSTGSELFQIASTGEQAV